jgi:hypothetical protein
MALISPSDIPTCEQAVLDVPRLNNDVDVLATIVVSLVRVGSFGSLVAKSGPRFRIDVGAYTCSS